MKKKLFGFLFVFICFSSWIVNAQNNFSFDKYHDVSEVQQIIKKIEQQKPGLVQLHTIATSPGGSPVTIIEIGKDKQDVPAIFVGANFEGNIPLSTEGALAFTKMLLDSIKYIENLKWYILPLPNPDAAKGYFQGIKFDRTVNDFAVNDDIDEVTNEDGPDDLNGDGIITKMRYKDLEGTFVISKNDPRIMDKADAKKGERGAYKVVEEGIDNDGDGKYNEDGIGGINPGISFPFLFPFDKKEAGQWSGQSPETYAILRFIFDRPNIAMIYTIGNSNFCLVPPKGGRKGGTNLQSIKIPARYARMMNADPNKTYTIEQVIEFVKPLVPTGTEVTSSMVAGILGLGAAVNPLEEDLKFYTKFSEDYKEYLKAKKFNIERLDPAPAKDGSFELWAYYHLGVPSFSMNLFTVPKVKEEKKTEEGAVTSEQVEKMTSTEFIALGEEKINEFLKANNASEKYNAKGITEMMTSGQLSPKQMIDMLKNMPKQKKEAELSEKDKALLAWSDSEWGGKGFVSWQKVKHPEFDDVEVGGYVPYLETTPREKDIDSLLQNQLPWLLKLSEKIPSVLFADEKVTDMGGGVYKLEIFVENRGYLPYPIAMGQRNKQPAPVVITIDGDVDFLEGISRTPVGDIGGNQVKKITWIIKTDKKPTITAKIESAVFGTDVKQIKIGG